MLCEDKIIALYCIVDDILKGMEHGEDVRRKVSDSETVTSAIVSALYFRGHLDNPFLKGEQFRGKYASY